MQVEKRNLDRMADAGPGSDDQVLQSFLTDSSWNYREVMDRVALDADACMGGADGTELCIDESALQKKGNKSAGVARRWNGRLCKIGNYQVGVYGELGKASVSV